MGISREKPQARPMFRKLAHGMAIVGYLLTLVFALAPSDNSTRLLEADACLFVGFAMLTIAITGFRPPSPSGRRTHAWTGLTHVGQP
jgi:hypothetical protein